MSYVFVTLHNLLLAIAIFAMIILHHKLTFCTFVLGLKQY